MSFDICSTVIFPMMNNFHIILYIFAFADLSFGILLKMVKKFLRKMKLLLISMVNITVCVF